MLPQIIQPTVEFLDSHTIDYASLLEERKKAILLQVRSFTHAQLHSTALALNLIYYRYCRRILLEGGPRCGLSGSSKDHTLGTSLVALPRTAAGPRGSLLARSGWTRLCLFTYIRRLKKNPVVGLEGRKRRKAAAVGIGSGL